MGLRLRTARGVGARDVTAPGRRERLAAWYVTGPLGHLVAGVADWAQLLGRCALCAVARVLRGRHHGA